jgi:hypothetical protein
MSSADLSLLRDTPRGLRVSDLELERDLDLEVESRLRDLRDLGGEGLREVDDLRLRDGRGERDMELSDGVDDLRRVPRSGLRPRPLPPRSL